MRPLLTILAATLLTVGACGDDDDGQARTIETTTTISEDAGGGDDSTSTSEPSSDDTDSSLSEVVVQLEDLPTGFSEVPPEEEGTDDFCGTEDPLAEPVEEAESSFSQSDFGPFVASAAGRYESDDQAEELLNQFAELLPQCDGYVEVDEDGAETTYSTGALSFPQIGDDTYAARVTAESAFVTVALDVAIARQGDVLVYLINGGVGGGDTSLTESLVRTMVDRL